MKTRVGHPRKPFGSMAEAQAWVDSFVRWYNREHRHSALNWVTPMDRHSALNWVTPMDRHTGHEHVLLRRRQETYRKSSSTTFKPMVPRNT
jgi:transposase InsO family protein